MPEQSALDERRKQAIRRRNTVLQHGGDFDRRGLGWIHSGRWPACVASKALLQAGGRLTTLCPGVATFRQADWLVAADGKKTLNWPRFWSLLAYE